MGRIGFFGGTFNPVHKGHIRALTDFIRIAHLDKTIVMPTGIPPHKKYDQEVSNADRLQMLNIAVGKIAEISNYEISKGGKSYTLDTVTYLRQLYPNDDIYLYVGSDMLLSMNHAWYKVEEIFDNVTVFSLSRTGNDIEQLRACAADLEKQFGAKIIFAQTEPLPMTSTDVRVALKERRNLEQYLVADVINYIEQRGLYL